ncbi:MAG: hypothetical protein IKO72_05985 [Kiritimatiellae bacterium]|nr:hypothetical protein [Kiritimatiellia bacterium]
MKCCCESSQGIDPSRLRHGMAFRTSIFGDCPHLHNGYLDKVLSVAEGKERRTFTYHVDGQLATATRTGGPRSVAAATGRAASPLAAEAETETFLWDGLALIRRGSTAYVNEPHPGGGAAIASSKDGVMFNDILGTTLGTEGKEGYVPVELSAFGDASPSLLPTSSPSRHLFTGKPDVDGLGYAFLFRNYRAGLGKWQTADPLGYPDGWNQLTYCGNELANYIDCFWAFTFGVYDYSSENSLISSVSDISIHRGGGTGEGGACLETIHASLNLMQKTISIKFLVGIQVSSSAQRSSSISVGAEVEYCEHRWAPGDATFTGPLVYEAILAHERGHANYALQSTTSILQMRYAALEIAWQGGYYTDDEISQQITDIFAEVQVLGWEGSNRFANTATSSWFESDKKWRQIYHSGRDWKWEKVE